MKGPAVVDFTEGNVEPFASEDANEKNLRVTMVTHSRPPSLAFPMTERPSGTADAPTTLRDLRHFEKTQ